MVQDTKLWAKELKCPQNKNPNWQRNLTTLCNFIHNSYKVITLFTQHQPKAEVRSAEPRLSDSDFRGLNAQTKPPPIKASAFRYLSL